MGSNGGESTMISGKDEATCPETTIEIKIKTLNSQTYTLRVDKCVAVPALKEQIASVTGVLSEQQHLICRGKVLKDDQLLSAYNVEDGHTLHLVVRQPVTPPSESSPDTATDPASTSGPSHHGVLVESFNISDGAFPDLGPVVSAVLGSMGLTSNRSGGEGTDLNELPSDRLSAAPVPGGLRISSRQQTGQADSRRQSTPDSGASSHLTVYPTQTLQPPVIPDSLATLSQNLSRLRQEFISNAEEQSNTSQAAGAHERNGQSLDGTSFSRVPRGLPTPASLADVMFTTRQILNEQAAESLLQLARQLQTQANVTDASERMRIHSNASRSGILFQNLGAVLLELGRTTMTLRLGETPADAVVNAGPAVFLSNAGPNPIMVQPLPFQPGMGLGAISGGTVQQSSGVSGGSIGSGDFSGDIIVTRVRRGSFIPSNVNRRESTGSQNPGQTAPTASNHGNLVQGATAGGSGSSTARESEVRVVPIRAGIGAVPASGRSATSDPSHDAMGAIYPVLMGVQHVTSGNLDGTRAPQASDEHLADAVDLGSEPLPDSVVHQENIRVPGVDGSSSSFGGVTDGQGFSAQIHSGLHQLLGTLFPGGENLHVEGGDRQGMDSDSVIGNFPATQNADNSQGAAAAAAEAAEAGATEEGTFLSHLLRQIMPIISENRESNSNTSLSDTLSVNDGNRQDSTGNKENADQGTSSRERDDPPSQPSSKRQKGDY